MSLFIVDLTGKRASKYDSVIIEKCIKRRRWVDGWR